MGEIIQVAEAEEGVVVVPDIFEVAEVEVEAAIRVSVHVRHPVVAVGTPSQAMYDVSSRPPRRTPALLCILFRALNTILARWHIAPTYFIFFIKGSTRP